MPIPSNERRCADERARGAARTVKRSFDIVAASAAMLGLAPLGGAIAVLVKATSDGPVFYRQRRVGRNGQTFMMVKFRTMEVGTHDAVGACTEEFERFAQAGFKLPQDDPRITATGRWLRRTSLDELPQLLNIVRGDMSVVGPRPVEPAQLSRRPAVHRSAYEAVRPGLTGVWQVSGRSKIPEPVRHEMDTRYAATWSLLGDLRIIWATPAALLRSGETA